MKNQLLGILLGVVLTGCVARSAEIVDCGPFLSTIHIVDQEGFSQVISQKDRLAAFANTDPFASQPYQKMLAIFQRDLRGKVRAILTTYFPSGQIHNYVEIEDNRAFGRYLEWAENGTLVVSANLVGGEADVTDSAKKTWLFDGTTRAWNDQGQLIAEITYSKGLLEGPSCYYHSTGKIWKQLCYHDNELTGDVDYYYQDGQLLCKTHYEAGKKDGLSRRYYPNGELASSEFFIDGLLDSGEYFDNKGKILASVFNKAGVRAVFGKKGVLELQEIIGGIPEGKVSSFNEEGQLVKEYHIKKFQKDGEEIFYQEGTLKPRILITWREGKIHGLVKTWYDTGEIESEREMSGNAKNGHFFAWFRDGGLMLVERYENDRLVDGKYYRPGEDSPISEVKEGKGIATLFDDAGRFLQKVSYLNGSPEDSA